jgi:hypothetical protein
MKFTFATNTATRIGTTNVFQMKTIRVECEVAGMSAETAYAAAKAIANKEVVAGEFIAIGYAEPEVA